MEFILNSCMPRLTLSMRGGELSNEQSNDLLRHLRSPVRAVGRQDGIEERWNRTQFVHRSNSRRLPKVAARKPSDWPSVHSRFHAHICQSSAVFVRWLADMTRRRTTCTRRRVIWRRKRRSPINKPALTTRGRDVAPNGPTSVLRAVLFLKYAHF